MFIVGNTLISVEMLYEPKLGTREAQWYMLVFTTVSGIL